MKNCRSKVIYSDEFSVNLHFLYKNEHFLATIRRILVFECIGMNRIETKQTSPMTRLGQNWAYAGMISRSHDGFNRTFIAPFIVPNRMSRRSQCAVGVRPTQPNKCSLSVPEWTLG